MIALIDLPGSVLSLVEMVPVEDIVLSILRNGLPDVPIVSLIAEKPPEMFILVRRLSGGVGNWRGHPRFIDFARFAVHTYTTDPDGDEKGALLSEAARVVLREAWLNHHVLPNNMGSVVKIIMSDEPSRETDWATSSGPVQFADLPTGYWRYQSQYRMTIRKAL